MKNSLNAYRKKPIIIEAIQWTGNNLVKITEFIGDRADPMSYRWDDYVDLVMKNGLFIYTLEGQMKANINDYIIKGVSGECYPCKPDIFKLTYEKV